MYRVLNSLYADEKWNVVRKSVYRRDGYKCMACGEDNSVLHCHHIIPAKDLPFSEFYDKDNLITLCRDCHDDVHGRFIFDRSEINGPGWVIAIIITLIILGILWLANKGPEDDKYHGQPVKEQIIVKDAEKPIVLEKTLELVRDENIIKQDINKLKNDFEYQYLGYDIYVKKLKILQNELEQVRTEKKMQE